MANSIASRPANNGRLFVWVVALLSLALSACSGGGGDPRATSPSSVSSTPDAPDTTSPEPEPEPEEDAGDATDDTEADPAAPEPVVLVAPLQRRTAQRTPLLADFNHVTSYGQSLSVHAGPTQSNYDDNLIRTFAERTRLPLTRSSSGLVPLFQDEATGIMAAAVNQMAFLAGGNQQFSGDPSGPLAAPLVLSGHGSGGRSIDELGHASPFYRRGLHQMQEVQRLATSGASAGLYAVGYFQGESDAARAADDYEQRLIALKNRYLANAASVYEVDLEPRFYIYQIASDQFFRDGADLTPNVPLAQWNAANADDDIVLVGPTYWLEHPDGVHFSRDGYRHFGLLVGTIMYRVAFRGEAWQPLQPTEARAVDSDTIDVQFHVPSPPLVFDITHVSDPGDYGFVVRQAAGTTAEIEQIRLIDDTTVRIDLALGSTIVGASVEYAWRADGGTLGGPHSGPRGNLRDSEQVTPFYAGDYPLYNWSVRFAIDVSAE